MLHIWGRLSSINVRKVVWCALDVARKPEPYPAADPVPVQGHVR